MSLGIARTPMAGCGIGFEKLPKLDRCVFHDLCLEKDKKLKITGKHHQPDKWQLHFFLMQIATTSFEVSKKVMGI
jgi:hypothetical protein